MGLRPSPFPMIEWTRGYDRSIFSSDLTAAAIVTVMLIPQSLAYAALAGLPPQVGLYASIAPLLIYALLGSSRVLAVGPVAVVSLMTATAIGDLAQSGSAAYWTMAITLAFISGAMLLVMGLLRLGFLANFLSHPVIAGFITASALLIAAGQLKVILGLTVDAQHFVELVFGLLSQASHTHVLSAALGLATVGLLLLARHGAKPLLSRLGLGPRLADGLAKAAPVLVIAAAALLTWANQWQDHGVRIVGTVPQGLPPFTLPALDWSLWRELAVPALLISVVGFVESVSVGQTLAAKRRQRIVPDRELVALGASNLGAAMTGGFPVTGGFARSVVNFEAGLMAGVALSLLLYLYKTSRPHIAEVGLVPGTEHFRNVLRHQVHTSPKLATLRVDESLYFANARVLEDRVNALVAERPMLQHLVLQCSAINDIDASALESLEAIDQRLRDAGLCLHLSEIKGPVMDRLQATDFLNRMSGQVFLSQYQAISALAPDTLASSG